MNTLEWVNGKPDPLPVCDVFREDLLLSRARYVKNAPWCRLEKDGKLANVQVRYKHTRLVRTFGELGAELYNVCSVRTLAAPRHTRAGSCVPHSDVGTGSRAGVGR